MGAGNIAKEVISNRFIQIVVISIAQKHCEIFLWERMEYTGYRTPFYFYQSGKLSYRGLAYTALRVAIYIEEISEHKSACGRRQYISGRHGIWEIHKKDNQKGTHGKGGSVYKISE